MPKGIKARFSKKNNNWLPLYIEPIVQFFSFNILFLNLLLVLKTWQVNFALLSALIKL